jgi:hypothetical protein
MCVSGICNLLIFISLENFGWGWQEFELKILSGVLWENLNCSRTIFVIIIKQTFFKPEIAAKLVPVVSLSSQDSL